MDKTERKGRLNQIRRMVEGFGNQQLNEELTGYALKLCETLGRKRKLNIRRGKTEIWAAAIVYAIARLNFLFDAENENHLTPDSICEFFGTKKSTIGNKATQIEKACNLELGAEGYCSRHISESFTLVETPEGFILPKSMLAHKEVVIEFVEGEEAEELNRLFEEQQRIEEQKAQERKARRSKVGTKRDDRQLSLFDES
jgi:Domain of unknown function (DUF6398)